MSWSGLSQLSPGNGLEWSNLSRGVYTLTLFGSSGMLGLSMVDGGTLCVVRIGATKMGVQAPGNEMLILSKSNGHFIDCQTRSFYDGWRFKVAHWSQALG